MNAQESFDVIVVGGSALRVMGTSFATGQAAGVAAALLASGTSQVAAIQHELTRQGAYLRAETLPVVATQALAQLTALAPE